MRKRRSFCIQSTSSGRRLAPGSWATAIELQFFGFGFRVQCFGFGVRGLGVRVQGLGFGVRGLGV